MLGAGGRRLLFSCTLRGARENIASSLRSRCGSIRTLSYLNHLQTQFACYTYPLWRSTLLSSQAGRHLSLVTTNYKPENADKSSHIAEELELEEEFAEDAGSPMQLLRQLRQGGYVRMDDIKHLKKVKQLRFTRHIQNLVKEGKMKKAREVFEQMKQAQVQLDDLIFNVLIAGYRRQGNVWACFKLFNEMKKRSILPTDYTYSSMFGACAEAGPKSTKVLKQLREEIERRNVVLDSISTNALMTALIACGFHDDARDVYNNGVKSNVTSDIQMFTVLLSATLHDKEGGFEAAQRVWSEMPVSPDVHCFSMLLQCIRNCTISSLEEVDEEKRTIVLKFDQPNYTRLHVSGVAPFSLGDGSKMKVYVGYVVRKGKARGPTIRWLETEDVEVLLSYLEKLQLQPDIRTFHLLAQLTFDLALLMSKMTKLKGKVVLDNKFVVAAIKQQAMIRNITTVKMLLDYARKANLDCNQADYQAYASCCWKEKEGIELIDEMRARGMLPNKYVLGTLLGNATRSRSYEYLTAVLKKMMHLEVAPNNAMLAILEAAAQHKPHDVQQEKRLNGFKGYYKIWKGVMVPRDEKEESQDINETEMTINK